MEDFTFPINCSVPKSVFNVGAFGNDTTQAVGFGTMTGIIVVLLTYFAVSVKGLAKKHSINIELFELFDHKLFIKTALLIVLLMMLPIFVVLLIFAMCYKLLCSVIIKRNDKHFVSFLDSFDVFWNLEGDSVINILGVIESDSPEALVENMKHKLENLTQNRKSDKIFYRRNEEYGFYYWSKHSIIDMSEYIEILELPDKSELSETDLEDILADLSNKSMPYNDEGLFKVLVTKQRIINQENENGEYGIIFRIHHSVGDGVALIEFLCESLADAAHRKSSNNAFNMSEFRNYGTPDDLLKMIRKLCEIPLCFVDLILRKPDENSLHGPSMLGMKHFRWTESDENLLIMVKEIKDKVDLNFSDVIATALAGGLNNYFNKTMAHVPEDVAVIVPIRFPPSPNKKDMNRLKNDFTVSMFDLPVKEHRNLSKIRSRFADFRLGNEYLANHFLLKLASILPKQILNPMFYSKHATVTFSNMPGPHLLSICGGNILRKLVFFVPLKGSTGVGVAAFCYGGVLRLTISADAALVPNPDDLDFILDGMVAEIRQLHEQYVKI